MVITLEYDLLLKIHHLYINIFQVDMSDYSSTQKEKSNKESFPTALSGQRFHDDVKLYD